MTIEDERICHIRGCKSITSHKTVFCIELCIDHWHMAPKEMQVRISRNYVSGQGEDITKMKSEWVEASLSAIRHIQESEDNQ